MEKTRGGRVRFDPERVVMAGGATGANESIIFCLADPDDAFLVPSPYYPAYVSFILYLPFFFLKKWQLSYIHMIVLILSLQFTLTINYYIKGNKRMLRNR